MNTKFTLAIIALVGIGVFALPSTMSLFSGQHSFYNIDATGNQIPCTKCHGDVKAELGANADPLNPTRSPGPHAAMSCEECHRLELGASSGDDVIYELHYQNTTATPSGIIARRTLYITAYDAEYRNIPEAINNTLVGTGSGTSGSHGNALINAWNLAHNASLTNPKYMKGAALSPSTDPTYTGMLHIVEHGGAFGAYDPLIDAAGAPKDKNSQTWNSGVRLERWNSNNAVNATTGWIMNGTAWPETSYWGMGSRTVNPGTSYHAASLVSCIECHAGLEPLTHEMMRQEGEASSGNPNEVGNADCSNCHYGTGLVADGTGGQLNRNFWAGGFGVTNPLKFKTDTGSIEAHNAWILTEGVGRFTSAPDGFEKMLEGVSDLPEVNNDACIACHTHIAINIKFGKGYKLEIDADREGSGDYIVSNAAVAGKVRISVYGNQSGQTFAVSGKSITWNSVQPMYINGQGSAVVLDLNGEPTDDATALQP